ncbi:MAG: TIGR03936 family radical SAM-associated protein [Oscillospiraceae bacterium]
MRIIRIFFTKTGEAAYISHLDLQRAMARALRRSELPVWYSQGFNPHIYMTFALPLPLMQESLVETVDCKTEAEDGDFSRYLAPLNKALPRGIVTGQIAEPVFEANEIAFAEYSVYYSGYAKQIEQAVPAYNVKQNAPVVRKTKRTEEEINLKDHLPKVLVKEENGEAFFQLRLPAGSRFNINAELFTGFLQRQFSLPAADARIVRTGIYTAAGNNFC